MPVLVLVARRARTGYEKYCVKCSAVHEEVDDP